MKDYLIGLLISVAGVFAPIKEMIITCVIVIAVDLVTGVLAAKKRGEKITSAGIRRTVSKFLIYITAIAVGFLVETFMMQGFLPVSKLAAGLIGVVEIKSCLENLDAINGSPLFKTLIKKLGSVNDDKTEVEVAPKEEK